MADRFELKRDEQLRLGLHYLPEPKWKPLVFDWNDSSVLRRVKSASKKDLLFRALAGREGKPLAVLDATLGLGLDSLSLLHLGCCVTGCERNPMLQALWREALHFYASDSFWAPQLARFSFHEGSALPAMAAAKVDAIYLDPMHEEKRDSASAPRKEMQMLRLLVGHDEDAPELLRSALLAGKRVVVKRPDKALPLAGISPHHSLEGPTVRFDVYEPEAGVKISP